MWYIRRIPLYCYTVTKATKFQWWHSPPPTVQETKEWQTSAYQVSVLWIRPFWYIFSMRLKIESFLTTDPISTPARFGFNWKKPFSFSALKSQIWPTLSATREHKHTMGSKIKSFFNTHLISKHAFFSVIARKPKIWSIFSLPTG